MTAILVLLLTGLPVAFALALVAVGVFIIIGKPIAIPAIADIFLRVNSNFILVALPLFILMGEFLIYSGIGANLYEMGSRWLSRLQGGLGVASIIGCGVFGAMCGVSSAGTATIGIAAIPEMRSRGYSTSLAVGTCGGAGCLAAIIPPSVVMIVYASLTDVSLGKLFIGGIGPGLLLIGMFSIYVWFLAKYWGMAGQTFSVGWRDRFSSLSRVWPALLLIMGVLGTIYLGVATPSEAAALGAFLALVLGVTFGRLRWREIKNALFSTVIVAGMLMIIITCALYLGHALTLAQVPQAATVLALSLPVSPYVTLALLFFMMVVMGCFLDPITIITLSTPLVFPALVGLGFDPLWYGLALMIVVEVATLTPPIGSHLFVLKGIAPDVPLGTIIRGNVPFALIMLLGVVVITIFPEIVTWLPNMMVR